VIAAPYVFTSLLDKEGEKGGDIMKKAGFTEIFAQTQTPQVVLDHQLYLADGKLLLVLDYVEQAFDDEMLSAMFKDYTDRVEALADNENWEEVYD
jgi:non-ribosomal peptide synthetase component F